MKMSDFFDLPVSDDFVSKMDHSQCIKFVSDGVAEFDAVVYSINNHDRLEQENEDLISVLSNAISGWDYEEVAHHCGVDAETASRVIDLINKRG